MLNLFKKKEMFTSPCNGQIVKLENVNDPVFAEKMMGDGFAIIPTNSCIYAPLSGAITVLFPTNHAIGIKTKDGKEFLIHIGINTVELNGKGFKSFTEQGSIVKQGDKLIEFDLNYLKSNGFDTTIMIVYPNKDVIINELPKYIEENQKLNIVFK